MQVYTECTQCDDLTMGKIPRNTGKGPHRARTVRQHPQSTRGVSCYGWLYLGKLEGCTTNATNYTRALKTRRFVVCVVFQPNPVTHACHACRCLILIPMPRSSSVLDIPL